MHVSDLLVNDRRASSSSAAYAHPWTYNRRLSGSPQPAITNNPPPYRKQLSSQNTLDDLPDILPKRSPVKRSTDPAVHMKDEDKFKCISRHSPECVLAAKSSTNADLTADTIDKNKSVASAKTMDLESESSSLWTEDDFALNSTTTSNSKSVCTCQLLWQMERDTDSIDKFKLFFKRDDRNVDWDYVQGSSEV